MRDFNDEINDLLEKLPLVPFDITVASGAKFKVERPGNIALGRTTMYFYDHALDRMTMISISQITHVDVLTAA